MKILYVIRLPLHNSEGAFLYGNQLLRTNACLIKIHIKKELLYNP